MVTGIENRALAMPGGRFTSLVDRSVRVALGLLLLGMVGLNVASAMGRYLFGYVITGADEVLVFSMVWLVMVGLILVTADRDNIALDVLPNWIGARARRIILIFNHGVMTLACATAAYHSWHFVSRVAAIGQKSMALGLPMAVPHFALVIGFAGTAIVTAMLVARDLLEIRSSGALHGGQV